MKYIHVKALKPRYSPLRFKIEAGTTGTLEIYSENTQTLVNEWEDFVFDFSSMDGTYPILDYMPDFEGPLLLVGDIDIFFDDIVLSDRPFQILTGVREKSIPSALSLFPNPSRDKITLVSKSGVQAITLLDIHGKKTLEFKSGVPVEQTTIDIKGLKNGIYLLRVRDRTGLDHTAKFIKTE